MTAVDNHDPTDGNPYSTTGGGAAGRAVTQLQRYSGKLTSYARQEMWGVFTAPWDDEHLTINQMAAEPLLAPETDRFFADPLAVAGRPDLVLVEEMDFRSGYGRLTALDCRDPSGRRPIPVLDDGIHASYPMTYRHGDEVVLVPERAQANRLEYYRLNPDSLIGGTDAAPAKPPAGSAELVDVALDGRIVIDPTIVEHNETFYLFYIDGCFGIDQHLELYVADSLFGPWTRHPDAPVATDPRWARPGGRLFRTGDGRLIRPAQNCRPHYGASLALREVTELSPDRYREQPVVDLASMVSGYTAGLHTLDLTEPGRCVFDAKTYRSVLSSPGLRNRTVQRARRRIWRLTKSDGGLFDREVVRR